jgi:two-component system chemotaxis response regulator CheY
MLAGSLLAWSVHAMPKCILIVDDSATVRTIIRGFLEEAGFEVCGEAIDGVDAIEKAKELKPDLMILDLAMPRMNGAEAASVLKRMTPDVPIIMFTMYEEVMVKSRASAFGVDLVLSKSEGLGQIMTHVQHLLGVPSDKTA